MATTVGTHYIARARADAEARLVEADEIVARLQHACGGSLGTRIAIPELLALVEKAQRYGLRLARQFEAIDGENRVTAWVEIAPVTNEAGESDGCAIDVVSWHSEELPPENDIEAARRRVEINRHTADCTARLDSQQRLLSLETEAS
ncbi:MAG TPA: sensor histidine kinase, partial [Erythrobacter sp.]|nr:sensor histidine kinase [Erythrobacter sp.]